MSAKWMRIETDFVDHPKVLRLATILGVSEADAGWYVMRTWSWMSRFCPAGQVRDIDGTSLETSCKWGGEPGQLLAALVRAEWLETWDSDGTPVGWQVHDWAEHQGKVAGKAAKERERKRAYRERRRAELSQSVPRDNHGTGDGTDAGRPAQRDVTGRDVTYVTTSVPLGVPEVVEQARLVEVPPSPVPAEALEDRLTDAEFQVFEHWRQTLRHPKAKATPERKRLLAKALRTYTVEDLQKAITGCSRSPHHMGENDRRTVYDDLELIIRDAKHVESFMRLAEGVAA